MRDGPTVAQLISGRRLANVTDGRTDSERVHQSSRRTRGKLDRTTDDRSTSNVGVHCFDVRGVSVTHASARTAARPV